MKKDEFPTKGQQEAARPGQFYPAVKNTSKQRAGMSTAEAGALGAKRKKNSSGKEC